MKIKLSENAKTNLFILGLFLSLPAITAVMLLGFYFFI